MLPVAMVAAAMLAEAVAPALEALAAPLDALAVALEAASVTCQGAPALRVAAPLQAMPPPFPALAPPLHPLTPALDSLTSPPRPPPLVSGRAGLVTLHARGGEGIRRLDLRAERRRSGKRRNERCRDEKRE